MSPALFSIALQPALVAASEESQSTGNHGLVQGYMDDAHFMGEPATVANMINVFRDKAQAVGLIMNPSKTKVITSSDAGLTGAQTELARIGIVNCDLQKSGIVLGSPIGSDTADIKKSLGDLLVQNGALLDQLSKLPDTQCAMLS
jgi:hypothetical protein